MQLHLKSIDLSLKIEDRQLRSESSNNGTKNLIKLHN